MTALGSLSLSLDRHRGTDNTTRKPVFLLRFNTAAEAHRAARTLDCTTAKLHNPFFVKAHVVW